MNPCAPARPSGRAVQARGSSSAPCSHATLEEVNLRDTVTDPSALARLPALRRLIFGCSQRLDVLVRAFGDRPLTLTDHPEYGRPIVAVG